MAKVLKHVYVQCFSFGDIHQLFLLRVGRTTQRSDLSAAQTMNGSIWRVSCFNRGLFVSKYIFLILASFLFSFSLYPH